MHPKIAERRLKVRRERALAYVKELKRLQEEAAAKAKGPEDKPKGP